MGLIGEIKHFFGYRYNLFGYRDKIMAIDEENKKIFKARNDAYIEKRRQGIQIQVDDIFKGWFENKCSNNYLYKKILLKGMNVECYLIACPKSKNDYLKYFSYEINVIGPFGQYRGVVGTLYFHSHSGKAELVNITAYNENNGFGSALIAYMEEILINNGCYHVYGKISPVDFKKKNKLEYFYKKNGYTITAEVTENYWGRFCKALK